MTDAEAERGVLTLAWMEQQHIQYVLNLNGWNKRQAARVLGIARSTLIAKVRKYGLTRGGGA